MDNSKAQKEYKIESSAMLIPTEDEISEIKRIFYFHSGLLDEEEGSVEIHFKSGKIIMMECGHDGQKIEIKESPWIDPFGHLSREIIENIEKK